MAVEDLNRFSKGATYGITKFMDFTNEEFASFPCGGPLSRLNRTSIPTEPMPVFNAELPTSWDWTTKGAVTPIKNQGQCGSCWAFSTIGMMEGQWFLKNKKLVGLSEQQLVDCSTESSGCGGGWPYWALTDLLQAPSSGRIDTEAGYPYTAEDGTCSFQTSDVGAKYTKYHSYCTESTSPCTETDMANLLVNVGPLSACLDAQPMQYYQGGVDNPSDCTASQIDHCITIVGFGSDAKGTAYWKIKNSWGADWGESGFYYLIRGTGNCGINQVITLATVA